MTAMHATTRSRVRPAFTLVEVLVVIALLALLAAMAVPMFQTDRPDRQMQLACDRLASLMAMCRAQAMLNGHPVQLAWQTSEDDPSVLPTPLVVHEADPISAPGQFRPMAASWATEPVLPASVRIRLVQPGEFDLSSLVRTQGRFDLPADPALQAVQFHPDGTADPAVFVLTARLPEGSEQEELQGWVILDGVSGLAHTKVPPTADEFDAMLKAQAALPDLQLQEKAVEVSQQSSTADMLAGSGITQSQLNEFIASLGGAASAGGTGAAAGASSAGRGAAAAAGTSGAGRGNAASGRNNGAPAAAGNRSGAGRNAGGNTPSASGGDQDDANNRANRPGRNRAGSTPRSGGANRGAGRVR